MEIAKHMKQTVALDFPVKIIWLVPVMLFPWSQSVDSIAMSRWFWHGMWQFRHIEFLIHILLLIPKMGHYGKWDMTIPARHSWYFINLFSIFWGISMKLQNSYEELGMFSFAGDLMRCGNWMKLGYPDIPDSPWNETTQPWTSSPRFMMFMNP